MKTLVSRAFQSDPIPQNWIWQEALGVIDSVHRDGRLPALRVLMDDTIPGTGRFRTGTVTPYEIALHPANHALDLLETFIHEVGHFLDALAFSATSGNGYGSENSAELEQWRKATKSTKAYQSMENLVGKSVALTQKMGKVMLVDPQKTQYYLEWHELFARSYSQWIALRSQNPELLFWYNMMRGVDSIYASEWEDGDFAPIATALDVLFGNRGWMI